MSLIGVFLVRAQSKCGKIRTRKTPNTDASRSEGRDIFKTDFFFVILKNVILNYYS